MTGLIWCLAANSSMIRVVAILPSGDDDKDFWPVIIGNTAASTFAAAPTVCSLPLGARVAMYASHGNGASVVLMIRSNLLATLSSAPVSPEAM